jgi:hypothetical protein
MAQRLRDYEHPFFRPLWRRIAIVVVCAAWAVLEFATGGGFWGMIAIGFTGYAAWQFLYLYKPVDPAADSEPERKE